MRSCCFPYWLMLPNCLIAWQEWKFTATGKERVLVQTLNMMDRWGSACESGDARQRRPSSLVHPPTPAKEAPPQVEEIMCRITKAEQLEEEGRSPSLLLTQQLAQMAAEARPSTLGKGEPVRKKLWSNHGRQSPLEGIPPSWKGGEDQEVPAWHSCSLGDAGSSKRVQSSSFGKLPFSHLVCEIALEVGKYDLHFQGSTIICLQEAAEEYIVGLM